MMSWSVVAMAQAGLTNRSGFFVTRALMGLIEGGFIADTILYLSYFYTAAELTIRLSYFWVSLTVTNIIGAFLAAGILELRHSSHMSGWRWLFALEGALTFLIGFWALFYLPPGPTETHKSLWGRIRHKGWFTEREEVIMVNRVLRDDPTKSSSGWRVTTLMVVHNREGLSLEDLWRSLTDFDLWPLYLIGITTFIAPATVGAYFTLTLKSLGFSTLYTNLLIIPSSILTMLGNLSLAYLSNRRKERLGIASIGSWWLLVTLIILVFLPDSTSKWGKWAILTVIVGFPVSNTLPANSSTHTPSLYPLTARTPARCARGPSPPRYTTCSCRLRPWSRATSTSPATSHTTTRAIGFSWASSPPTLRCFSSPRPGTSGATTSGSGSGTAGPWRKKTSISARPRTRGTSGWISGSRTRYRWCGRCTFRGHAVSGVVIPNPPRHHRGHTPPDRRTDFGW